LHITGSNKPLGPNPNNDKIPFFPYFYSKDILPIVTFIITVASISFIIPFFLNDPENFNIANPLNTPIHIQPE
jgi:ubiquinol-cytochrome c reductase cytochrome b subunit